MLADGFLLVWIVSCCDIVLWLRAFEGAAIGVCGTDVLEDATAERLLKAADDAMYASKRNGKNRVILGRPNPRLNPDGKQSHEKID